MKETVSAVYLDGVLKLAHPLPWLDDNCQVEVTVAAPTKMHSHPLESCFGIMPDDDAKEMMRIIDEEFEQVDPQGECSLD